MVAFEEQLAPTASGQHLIIGLLLGVAFSILIILRLFGVCMALEIYPPRLHTAFGILLR